MDSLFRITPVEPTGSRSGGAGFICRTGGQGGAVARMPDVRTYPPSPRGEALRALRVRIGLGARAAAAKIGISGADLGRLERGEATLESDNEWDRAEALLDLDPVAGPVDPGSFVLSYEQENDNDDARRGER